MWGFGGRFTGGRVEVDWALETGQSESEGFGHIWLLLGGVEEAEEVMELIDGGAYRVIVRRKS